MSFKITIAAAGIAIIATNAFAADVRGSYPPPLPPPPAPRAPVVYEPLGWGWYVRGDIGYRYSRVGDVDTTAPFAAPTDNHLGKPFVAGVGAGVKSRWVRTDATIEYSAPMKYRGTSVTTDDSSAKIQANTALLNAYVDLGSWKIVTPYVGAAAGASYIKTSDFVSPTAPPFTAVDSNNQWKFTWALMAGVGWQVAPNMMLDVGYRYINFGDVRTASDASGFTTFKNVAGHEVRVGLRWSYDDIPITQ